MDTTRRAHWLSGAWAVFEKDVREELRSRYAINMLLMFVASTLFLLLLAVGQESLSESVQSALLWVIILFSSVIGLGRGFISEVEQGTVLLLRLHTRASMVYAGKLVFNFFLVLALNSVALIGFVFFLNIETQSPGWLVLILVLGALGISGTTTLLAAIIARTAGKGPLLAVLAFPLLIPLLMSVVEATEIAFQGATWDALEQPCLTLFAFGGAVISASVLLFDFVWHD